MSSTGNIQLSPLSSSRDAPPLSPPPNESVEWNGKTIALFTVGICTLVVSAVAFALIFTPVGAGIGTLLAAGGLLLALGGVVTLLLAYNAHSDQIYQINRCAGQVLKGQNERVGQAELFALNAINVYAKTFVSMDNFFALKPSSDHDQLRKSTAELRRTLPNGMIDTSQHDAHDIAACLETLFTPYWSEEAGQVKDPLIRLLPESFEKDTWGGFKIKIEKANLYPLAKTQLIEELTQLFKEQSLVVSQYFLLFHAIAKRNASNGHYTYHIGEKLEIILHTSIFPRPSTIRITGIGKFIMENADKIFADKLSVFLDSTGVSLEEDTSPQRGNDSDDLSLSSSSDSE